MRQQCEEYWLKQGALLNDRYKVVDVIEEGGSGIVYLGEDMILQRRVSIKEYFPRRYSTRMAGREEIMTYPGEAKEQFECGLDRFIQEARILAHFESLDGIVGAKDFFYQNETAYMVMEYVQGENVSQYVKTHGRMQPEQVVEVMQTILQSLEYLHQQGVLHFDISPDNIILPEDGTGILVDFGAARQYDEWESSTQTPCFKRGYSAAEQYAANAPKGAYTDVYGISTTMYFMLTAVQPEEAVQRLLCDRVIPLTRFSNIKMSRRQKKVIVKGMAVEADDRYETIKQFYDDLYKEAFQYQKEILVALLGVIVLSLALACQYRFHIVREMYEDSWDTCLVTNMRLFDT